MSVSVRANRHTLYRLGLAPLACIACAGLAACGGTSGSGSTASTPAAVATTSAPASAPVSRSGASQSPSSSGSVRFGQSSRVALLDFTTQKTHPIKLTLSLRAGSLADLKNFTLDAKTKQSTPYYLSIKVTNVGTAPIDSSGFAGLLTVDDSTGKQVSSLTLLGDFSKCQGEIPDKLAPGATGQECDVYTVPKGQRVSKVSTGTGTGAATITWS